MQYSKLAFKLRGKINEFSGYVSFGLDKTCRRFVSEAVYGMLESQSVLLTEIGRSLQDGVSLKKTEERFCRQLAKEDIWPVLQERVLEEGCLRVKEDTLLILDLGDIHKKYASDMEYLGYVRDGSASGAIVKGYHTNQIIASELGGREVVPLYQELYSSRSPDFVSENQQILDAIDRVSGHCDGRGTWVIDRGGDRGKIFRHLLKNRLEFIVRLQSTRDVLHGRTKKNVLEVANRCSCPYSETIVREENGQEKAKHIQYGYTTVRLPAHPKKTLYMLVVKGFGPKPMMLLTTNPLRRNRKLLYRVLASYIKRWGIEETIRFLKQSYDVENIRVLKYTRLRNMMAILLAVFYFMAVRLDTQTKLKIMVSHVLKQAKRVFGVPDFKYYAISDGLANIFKRSPAEHRNNNQHKKRQPPDQLKLAL